MLDMQKELGRTSENSVALNKKMLGSIELMEYFVLHLVEFAAMQKHFHAVLKQHYEHFHLVEFAAMQKHFHAVSK